MEKRVLLAVVLSIIVLYAHQALFPPPRPTPPPTVDPAAPQPAPDLEAPVPSAEPAPTPAETAGAEPVVADAAERDIVVETPAVQAVFTTRGGALRHWRLKRYAGDDGAPLDLVPARVPPGAPRPFSLSVDDAAIDAALARALYKPSADALDIGAGPGTLTFEYRDAGGLAARKTFAFDPARPYEILVSAEVTRAGAPLNPTVQWGPALGTGLVSSGLTYSPSPQPIFQRDGDVSRIGFGDIPEHRVVEGSLWFAGVDDHYFLTAVIPSGQPVRIQYGAAPVPVEGADRGLQFVSWSARYPAPRLTRGSSPGRRTSTCCSRSGRR